MRRTPVISKHIGEMNSRGEQGSFQKHRVLMHSKDSLTARAHHADEDLRWKSSMARLTFSRPPHVCSTDTRFKAGTMWGGQIKCLAVV